MIAGAGGCGSSRDAIRQVTLLLTECFFWTASLSGRMERKCLSFGSLLLTWAVAIFVQVTHKPTKVALVDNCDRATFNAAIGPGTCATTPHKHDTTFTEFLGLLFSPLAKNIIGHPAWNFAPGYISIAAGQTVRVTNAGGEGHTFTEVTDFGGGFISFLNGDGGPAGTVPLSAAGACLVPPPVVAPGNTVQIKGLAPGVHKFQCCIHPWMRAVVDVE